MKNIVEYHEVKQILRQMLADHDAEQEVTVDTGGHGTQTGTSVNAEPVDITQALKDGLAQVLAVLDAHGIELDNHDQLEELLNG
jgi:hypothetical protein